MDTTRHLQKFPMKCKIVARVLYDYEAQTEEELSIKEGGIVLITDDTDQDWWQAYERPLDTFAEGKFGLVPLTYVEEVIVILIKGSSSLYRKSSL